MNQKRDTERFAQGSGTGLADHGRPNMQPKYVSARKRHGDHSRIWIVAIVLAFGGGRQVHAGSNDWVWTGAGNSDIWFAGILGGATNWSPGGFPPADADVAFLNTTPFMSVDVQIDQTINSIKFDGVDSYMLRNGALSLQSGDITVAGSANHIIDTPISLLEDGFWNIADGSLLLLREVESDTATTYGIAKVGTGTLRLEGIACELDRLFSEGGPTNIDGTELNLRSLAEAIHVAGDGDLNIRFGSLVTCHPEALLYVHSNNPAETATMTISNSTLKPVRVLTLGLSENTSGHLVVEDNGIIEWMFELLLGPNLASEASTMIVRGGGKVNTIYGELGPVPGSIGTADVSGEDSRWDTNQLLLGGFGPGYFGGEGHVTVRDGAALTATEAGFYSTASTLTVSDAAFTVQRLSAFVGATPTIQLTNPAEGYAMTITNPELSWTGDFGGIIMDSPAGPGGLLKTGSGKQSLSNHNHYTGGTRIEEGELSLETPIALPPIGAVVLAGGTLNVNDFPAESGHFEMLGGAIVGTAQGIFVPQDMRIESGQISARIQTNMLVKETGGSVTFHSPVSAHGFVVAAGAVVNNATLHLPNLGHVIETGEFVNEGTVVGQLNVLQGGQLLGSGNASQVLVVNGGILSPGDDVGVMSIDTVEFGDNAFFRVDLFGALGTAGDDHDQLVVGSWAVLSGTLDVRFVDNFVPSPGASFVVLEAPAFQGTFDSVTFPEGSAGHVEYDQMAGTVTLVIDSDNEIVLGDMNCDSDVNLDDAGAFISTIMDSESTVSCDPMRADMNQDDQLNGADLQGFVDVLMMP